MIVTVLYITSSWLIYFITLRLWDFSGGSDGKESTCNRRPEFNPWVGKIPWRREWLPSPVSSPEKSHGQKSMVGYSSWSLKRVDHNWATKQQHTWFYGTSSVRVSHNAEMNITPPRTIQSVQISCSVVSDSLQPHKSQHAKPPCPSLTPGAYSNSCPSNQWCYPTISSAVVPFSFRLQYFPASGSFLVS